VHLHLEIKTTINLDPLQFPVIYQMKNR